MLIHSFAHNPIRMQLPLQKSSPRAIRRRTQMACRALNARRLYAYLEKNDELLSLALCPEARVLLAESVRLALTEQGFREGFLWVERMDMHTLSCVCIAGARVIADRTVEVASGSEAQRQLRSAVAGLLEAQLKEHPRLPLLISPATRDILPDSVQQHPGGCRELGESPISRLEERQQELPRCVALRHALAGMRRESGRRAPRLRLVLPAALASCLLLAWGLGLFSGQSLPTAVVAPPPKARPAAPAAPPVQTPETPSAPVILRALARAYQEAYLLAAAGWRLQSLQLRSEQPGMTLELALLGAGHQVLDPEAVGWRRRPWQWRREGGRLLLTKSLSAASGAPPASLPTAASAPFPGPEAARQLHRYLMGAGIPSTPRTEEEGTTLALPVIGRGHTFLEGLAALLEGWQVLPVRIELLELENRRGELSGAIHLGLVEH